MLGWETALSFSNRPLLWQPPSPFCHPERSRGICGSTDPSWKCFPTECSEWRGLRCSSSLAGHQSFARLLLQIGSQLFQGGFHADAVFGPQLVYLAVLDKAVGPADAHYRRFDLHVAERFQDGTAEATHENVVFKGHDDPGAASVLGQDFAVQWLDETGVDHGRGETLLLQFGGELLGHGHQGSQAENCHVVAVTDDFRFAYGESYRVSLDGRSRPCTARIAHCCWPGLLQGRIHHVRQLILIFGNHVDDVGDAAEIADVKKPVMGGAVIPGKTAAIHAEDDGQILQTDIVHDG